MGAGVLSVMSIHIYNFGPWHAVGAYYALGRRMNDISEGRASDS